VALTLTAVGAAVLVMVGPCLARLQPAQRAEVHQLMSYMGRVVQACMAAMMVCGLLQLGDATSTVLALQPDPRKRLGARAGPEELLQHPWFQVRHRPATSLQAAATAKAGRVLVVAGHNRLLMLCINNACVTCRALIGCAS
jgi:hypothetical protein